MRYRATPSFPALLSELRVTLVASLYLDNRLLLLSASDGMLRLRAHELARPMGLAVDHAGGRTRLAVSAHTSTLVFGLTPALAADAGPEDQPCDAVLLPRALYFSGDIDGHDAAWCGGRLVVVNTRFSCLAGIGDLHGFTPLWQPPFISALAPEDRCHLNGLACRDGAPAYATAFSATDEPQGWRAAGAGAGLVIDIASGRRLVEGLVVPHSPRLFGGRLHVLESGTGRVLTVDPASGATAVLAELPGFARGLERHGPVLFVGLSKLREGRRAALPVGRHGAALICGIAALDAATGATLGWIAFEELREVFDLRVLPGVQAVSVAPPFGTLSETALDLPGRVFRAQPPPEAPPPEVLPP